MSTNPVGKFLRPTRPWVWLISLVLLYQIVGAFVLPQVLKYQLIKISSERLQLDTKISSVEFDPYIFALLIEGLSIDDSDGNSLIAFDSLYFNVAPSSYLFSKTLEVQSFELTGLSALIELDPEGNSNIQKVAEAWAASSEHKQTEDNYAEASKPSEVTVQLNNFLLADAKLNLIDNQLATPFELVLQNIQLELEDLNTGALDPAQLRAELELASGGEIELAGEIGLMPSLETEIDLSIDELSLALLQPYLAESTQLELVEALIELEATLSSTAENTFAYDGSLGISNLDLQYDRQSLLSWGSLDLPNNSFSLAEKSLSVSEIRLSEAFARIIIDEQGGTNIGQSLAANSSPNSSLEQGIEPDVEVEQEQQSESESAPQPEPSLDISIGQISISSSAMHFGDFSLPLPFVTDISDLAGSVSTISNTSTEPASLDLGGQVGEFGLVDISGSLRPLNPKDLTNFELDFENIDMVDLSPYLISELSCA